MIDWLNQNDGAVVALGTLALVLVTTAYVALTQRLVAEQRRQRAASQVPVLRCEILPGFRFQIRNIGFGPAISIIPWTKEELGEPGHLAVRNLTRPWDLAPGETVDWQLETHRSANVDIPRRAWLPVAVRCADALWENSIITLVVISETDRGVSLNTAVVHPQTRRQMAASASSEHPWHKRPRVWWKFRKLDLGGIWASDDYQQSLEDELASNISEYATEKGLVTDR